MSGTPGIQENNGRYDNEFDEEDEDLIQDVQQLSGEDAADGQEENDFEDSDDGDSGNHLIMRPGDQIKIGVDLYN